MPTRDGGAIQWFMRHGPAASHWDPRLQISFNPPLLTVAVDALHSLPFKCERVEAVPRIRR
jgi:hypothetical protein